MRWEVEGCDEDGEEWYTEVDGNSPHEAAEVAALERGYGVDDVFAVHPIEDGEYLTGRRKRDLLAGTPWVHYWAEAQENT